MLELKDISLHYGASQILYDVSMSAEMGEVCCLMGTNGVGKTSLLKVLSGTHPQSGGSYKLDGEEVAGSKAHILAAKGIGYVPQGRDVFPLMTIQENLETGYACLPKDEHEIPDHIFELFPVLKQMINRRGGDLSGGQQQRLCIARAIAVEPRIILMDEPCSALDPIATARIEGLIDELCENFTIIIVTHSMQQAARVSQHTAFFHMEIGRAHV